MRTSWNHPEIEQNEEFKGLWTNNWDFPAVGNKSWFTSAWSWVTSWTGFIFLPTVLGSHCGTHGGGKGGSIWLASALPGRSVRTASWPRAAQGSWTAEGRQWLEQGRPRNRLLLCHHHLASLWLFCLSQFFPQNFRIISTFRAGREVFFFFLKCLKWQTQSLLYRKFSVSNNQS